MTKDTPISAVETGPAILALFYWLADNPFPASDVTHNVNSHIRYLICIAFIEIRNVVLQLLATCSDVLKQPPSLLAVTHLGLLRFNAHTLELLENLDFRGDSLQQLQVHILHQHLITHR